MSSDEEDSVPEGSWKQAHFALICLKNKPEVKFVSAVFSGTCRPRLPRTFEPVTLRLRDSTLIKANEGEAVGSTDGLTATTASSSGNTD